jgi:hypothetical protein
VSQIRLYLDEDSMRRSLVFGLKVRNVDVMTASDADMINRDDEDHLETATASGRVLYTFNTADYCAVHQKWMTQGDRMLESSLSHSNVTPLARSFGGSCGSSAASLRNRCETGSSFLSAWH